MAVVPGPGARLLVTVKSLSDGERRRGVGVGVGNSMCILTHIYTYAHNHLHTHVDTLMNLYMIAYTYMHRYTLLNTCTYTHIHVHTCIHKHTCSPSALKEMASSLVQFHPHWNCHGFAWSREQPPQMPTLAESCSQTTALPKDP